MEPMHRVQSRSFRGIDLLLLALSLALSLFLSLSLSLSLFLFPSPLCFCRIPLFVSLDKVFVLPAAHWQSLRAYNQSVSRD